MYESYSWPGAYSIKTEIKMITKKIKKLFISAVKKIEEKEKKI